MIGPAISSMAPESRALLYRPVSGSRWKATTCASESQADEGVAAAEGVVEEGERLVLGEGDQPEGQLAEFDGGLVTVDSAQAARRDAAPSLQGCVIPVEVGTESGQDDVGVAVAFPRLDDAVGEVPAGRDEERAGAHSRVEHLEFEQFARRTGLPVVGLGAVGWARGVAERGEGVLDDLLGQLARGVVGAGGAPVADLGDDQRPSREHGGQAAQVTAEQAAQRPDPLRQVRIVVAGCVERRQILGRIAHCLAQCPRAGIADLGQPLEEVAIFGGLLDLSQGEFRFELADEAEVRLVYPQAGELQQTLVHVPDLLDVQALVGEAFGGAAAAPQDEQGAEDFVRRPGR